VHQGSLGLASLVHLTDTIVHSDTIEQIHFPHPFIKHIIPPPTMTSEAQLIEDKALKVICVYQSDNFSIIRAAVDAVGALVQRVSRRLRDIPSRISKGGHNKRLTKPQELALYILIKRYDGLGLTSRIAMVTAVANLFPRLTSGLSTSSSLLEPNELLYSSNIEYLLKRNSSYIKIYKGSLRISPD